MYQKRDAASARQDKAQYGCIWGLFRIFKLRRDGSLRRFLTGGRKPGARFSRKRLSYSASGAMELSEERKGSKENTDLVSIKRLIADEMSIEKHQKNTDRSSYNLKEQKQEGQKSNFFFDHQSGDVETYLTKKPEPGFNFVPADQVVNVEGTYIYDYKVSQLEKKNLTISSYGMSSRFDDSLAGILDQRLDDVEFVGKSGKVYRSSDFATDALDLLESNNGSLLKVLSQDNSHKEIPKPNVNRFSRMRQKFWGKDPLLQHKEGVRRPTKIVVLKPGPPDDSDDYIASCSMSSLKAHQISVQHDDGERLPSLFSMKEIKRRVKQAIAEAKEQHRISMDGVLDKIPYGHLESQAVKEGSTGRQLSRKTYGSSKSPYGGDRKSWTPWKSRPNTVRDLASSSDQVETPKISCSDSLLLPRRSWFLNHKHVSEISNDKNEDETSVSTPTARTLGKVSLPDYGVLSPKLSSVRDIESFTVSDEIALPGRDPCYAEFSHRLEDEKIEHRSPASEVEEVQKPVLSEITVSAGIGSIGVVCKELENTAEMLKVDDGSVLITCTEVPYELSQTYVSHQDAERKNIAESNLANVPLPEVIDEATHVLDCTIPIVEELDPERSVSDSILLASPSSSPRTFLDDMLDTNWEKPEYASPISVLEPGFSEDIVSPESIHCQQDVLKPRPIPLEKLADYTREINPSIKSKSVVRNLIPMFISDAEVSRAPFFGSREVDFIYVRDILESAGFIKSEDFFTTWHSLDQPIDPELFLLIDPPSDVSVDQLVLFDCINEVLCDIPERFCGSHSLLQSLRPNVRSLPVGERLVEEVLAGLKLLFSRDIRVPQTLDQIVEKDLALDRRWLDLRCDAECVGLDIEVTILEELIEDAILEVVY